MNVFGNAAPMKTLLWWVSGGGSKELSYCSTWTVEEMSYCSTWTVEEISSGLAEGKKVFDLAYYSLLLQVWRHDKTAVGKG